MWAVNLLVQLLFGVYVFNFILDSNVGHFVLSMYVSRGGVGYFYSGVD
jgi:hypothetical protein